MSAAPSPLRAKLIFRLTHCRPAARLGPAPLAKPSFFLRGLGGGERKETCPRPVGGGAPPARKL